MSASPSWHLITGEYPPRAGGIADYSALVASELAARGERVHVWCPDAEGPAPGAPGVAVHRDAGRWAPADLARVGAGLDREPGPRRLLVQYGPNAWGYRGANLGFGRWLRARRAAGDEVWAMVHEGFIPFWPRRHPKFWALAAAQRLMMRDLLGASTRVYYSMPYWEPRLRPYAPRGAAPPMAWLPVPSNVPVVEDAAGVAATRARLAPGGEAIVGHFGTFGADFRALLSRVLPPLLEGRAGRVAVLIGRNGPGFAAELVAAHPGLAGRVAATGGLPDGDVSRHLQACDVLVQPYEFGVSTRRGTAMAGLAHGRAIATTSGLVTEPFWAESGCVATVPTGQLDALPGLVDQLLADPAARARLGRAARDAYLGRFSVEKIVAALLGDAKGA